MDCWVVLVRRDLLWHFWSECTYYYVIVVVIIQLCLVLVDNNDVGEGMGGGRLFICLKLCSHEILPYQIITLITGEDTRDCEWDHVTSHSMQPL